MDRYLCKFGYSLVGEAGFFFFFLRVLFLILRWSFLSLAVMTGTEFCKRVPSLDLLGVHGTGTGGL